MKAIINVINLRSAGGLNVAQNFLQEVQKVGDYRDMFYVLAPRACNYMRFQSDNIKILEVASEKGSYYERLYLDFYLLPKIVRSVLPDVIFSMGNFPIPMRMQNCPQALLFHWPYAIYPESHEVWKRLSVKDRLNRQLRLLVFKHRLRFSDLVFVQTSISANRLKRYYIKGQCVKVVPNAFTKLEDQRNSSVPQRYFSRDGKSKYLLYLSRYYPHKNIEILIDVAKEMRDRKLDFKLLITISSEQHPNVKRLLNRIQQFQLESWLINIGPVPVTGVAGLYGEIDGVIFPTLLESYSALYVDAMYFQKPMFTSDLDFSREICEESAFYFDPHSVGSILSTIISAFDNYDVIRDKIHLGVSILDKCPNWPEVASEYLKDLRSLAE